MSHHSLLPTLQYAFYNLQKPILSIVLAKYNPGSSITPITETLCLVSHWLILLLSLYIPLISKVIYNHSNHIMLLIKFLCFLSVPGSHISYSSIFLCKRLHGLFLTHCVLSFRTTSLTCEHLLSGSLCSGFCYLDASVIAPLCYLCLELLPTMLLRCHF